MTCLRCDGLVVHEYLLDSREGPVCRVNKKGGVCLLQN